MNVLKHIYQELSLLGLSNDKIDNLDEIRNRNGVYLYRIKYKGKDLVIKYFEKHEFRREIEYYEILKSLDIPTIEVIGYTKNTLLLEDLDKSLNYRLGIESDLSDIEVAKALASWYRKLHYEGVKFLKNNDRKFYKEMDYITKENIELVMNKTNTRDNKVWQLLIDHLDLIFLKIQEFEETFTYNDFYWTNLVVSKDKKEAFMFDYNMLGVGFRYSDIRNVCSSLSDEAGNIFLKEYEGINQDEKKIDEVVSILVSLVQACERDIFPKWAQEALDKVNNGELYKGILEIL
ncbi:hypothetical protein RBU61_02150 [Tissierella sp. MB52-C2]|uniref:phosphotransferase n=1 Tax=Tissierella sp. MB52-C2 TaxID=3070999 RepID=UPI00280B417A|nr:phosphotransferase [Tissierella sp. MB52-C2]WMM25486.1 hypothetical protein RBU61_02150 [Tissierella sp. MB52-C2]